MNIVQKSVVALATAAAVASFASSALAEGRYRAFELINYSDQTIYRVYATPIGVTWWSVDLLGAYVVYDGYTMRVYPEYVDGWCRFDIRIEFASGRSETVWDVNLCEASEVIVYPYDIYVI